MDKYPDQKRVVQYLYPPIDPFDQRMVDMGDGHRIYVEQCGIPDGIPVVILHGGPGGGCSPAMRRYFDPEKYRVILFDQRSCGRSRPTASIEHNTTWHLVADIERLRKLFEIADWVVFGGSWGATLALIYAQAYPDRVNRLVLRGVFLATQAELDWFYGGGAGKFWPEQWAKFTSLLSTAEQDDVISANNKRLFSGDRATELLYARAWSHWENALASLHANGLVGESPGEYARTFARVENHYFFNCVFLEKDGQILDQMDQIAHIPGHIVQGRYDMICPPKAAWKLSERWPNADLKIVQQAGHALSEPDISAELIRIMDRVAEDVT